MAKTQKNKATSFHLGMCDVVDGRCEKVLINYLQGSWKVVPTWTFSQERFWPSTIVAKLAKLKRELLTPQSSGGGGGGRGLQHYWTDKRLLYCAI